MSFTKFGNFKFPNTINVRGKKFFITKDLDSRKEFILKCAINKEKKYFTKIKVFRKKGFSPLYVLYIRDKI